MNRDWHGRVLPNKVDKKFIEDNIKNVSGCWEWQRTLNMDNYAVISVAKEQKRVSRLVWELWHGKLPEGFIVCHKCDNPKCVNPEHLFSGTIRDNNVDMFYKGRGRLAKKGEYAGENNPNAKLTERDILDIRNMAGGDLSQSKIAEIFGVSQTLISKIFSRKLWNI